MEVGEKKKNDNQLISPVYQIVCIQLCLVCTLANAGVSDQAPAGIRDLTPGSILIPSQ